MILTPMTHERILQRQNNILTEAADVNKMMINGISANSKNLVVFKSKKSNTFNKTFISCKIYNFGSCRYNIK